VAGKEEVGKEKLEERGGRKKAEAGRKRRRFGGDDCTRQ
jgi:hypothetical protein